VKETIYSIPINEAFEVRDGTCPVCRLHGKLTRDTLEYTLSPAMMEPDVRQRMNTQGFCPEHLGLLLTGQNRLPLALILETHLQEMIQNPAALFAQDSCYLCARIDGFLQAYYSNILHLWKTQPDFKAKWDAQPYLCRAHTAGLAGRAGKDLPRKDAARFSRELCEKAKATLSANAESLGVFIKSFDHRFADTPLGEHAQAVERTAAFWGMGRPD